MSTKVPLALLLNNKILRTKIPTINHEINNKEAQEIRSSRQNYEG